MQQAQARWEELYGLVDYSALHCKDGYVEDVQNLAKNGALNISSCRAIQQEPLKHRRIQMVTKNHYKSKLMSNECW